MTESIASLGRRIVGTLFRLWYGMPFPPTHYYSPLPDLRALRKNQPRWLREDDAPGLDWDLDAQLELAGRLAAYRDELRSLPDLAEAGRYGQGYGQIEAQILYLVLRHFRPAQVIEVGSGVSTVYTLAALQANGASAALTCIEPNPHAALRTLPGAAVDAREVQDVGFAPFEALAANDVLFVDSSHVSKKDSDVEFLVLQVLPRLRKGVIVHFHDIALPMPALPAWHPLFETYLFWNEAALLRAFLSFNAAFRIVMGQSYLHHRRPETLRALAPDYDPRVHFPSSLWLQKVA